MFKNALVHYGWPFKICTLMTMLTGSLMLGSCNRPEQEIHDHTSQVDSILDHTNGLLNGGEIKKAKAYLDSGYQSIPKPGKLDLWKKYDHKVNFYLNYEKDTGKARMYADSMLHILKGHAEKYKPEYAKSIFSHSEVLLAEKRYTEAFKSYFKGKTFARKYLDSCSYQEFTYKLGMVRYNQGEYLKAVHYFKQAATEGASCKESDGFYKAFLSRQSTLNTIALCYERAAKPDSAIYYYQQALSFIKERGAKYQSRKPFMQMARGVIFGNLGGVFAAQHNFVAAEKYLKESIRINDQPFYDIQDAQTAKIKLAGLYLQQQKFKGAEKLLNDLEAYLALQPHNNPSAENIRLKWYQLKWDYFDQTAVPLQAYRYSLKYHNFLDSVNRVKAGLKEVDLDHVFKDAEQRYKLALLNKDNQLKQGYLIGSILIAVLAFIVLGVVWFNLKNSRKLNGKMAAQNEQLQMTLNSLEQSQQENTRLLKVVAHDLRNPIGGIATLSTMMLKEGVYAKPDRDMLELIRTSGQNSLDLINDLLQFTAQQTFKKEPVDLFNLLNYCVALMHLKAKEKQQHIELDATPLEVNMNREKMWRVLSNLIANAIKFSPFGTSILVRMTKKDEHVLISVKDQGIGIPDEMKEKIFDMFTEARRVGTDGEQPFGMGLAIAKQIVEAHNGRIWFESAAGNGTTFYIALPL